MLNRTLLTATVLVIPCGLLAQPFIDTVFSPSGLSPGGIADIEGGFFDRTSTVQVGGLPAAVIGNQQYYGAAFGERGVVIQLPVGLTPGPTTLVVISTDGSSDPWPVTLDSYAPSLVGEGTGPVPYQGGVDSIRIDRALPSGGFGPPSCLVGAPPKAGELVRVYATGLGATDPSVPTGWASPASPLAHTLAKPSILIGGQAAEVMESVLAPGEIGVYRVTFKVPDRLGDDWQSITLAIGGKNTPGSLAHVFGGPRFAAAASIQTTSSCGFPLGKFGGILTGDPRNPSTSLGGVTVTVKDSQGTARLAPVLSVAPNQVEYIVPVETALGSAGVTITSPSITVSADYLNIVHVAPQVFTVAATGSPAALIVRVRNGVQTVEPAFQANAAGGFEPAPIDVGPETDQLFLIVFGTGWRNRTTEPIDYPGSYNTHAIFQAARGADTIAAVKADYAGFQGEFAGMDQVNVKLPRTLAGHSKVFVYLSLDDVWTDVFQLSFK